MMLLEQLVHRVEDGLVHLGRCLFKPDPLAELRADIARLSDDLRRRHDELKAYKTKKKDAERRLADNEKAVTLLSARVEMAVRRGESRQAWHLALEVDQLRQEIAADRKRLPRYEQTIWSIEFKNRQMLRELARLQEQLYEQPREKRA